MNRFRDSLLVSLALAGTLLGCGTEVVDPPPDPNALAIVSGQGQNGTSGQALANPLIVSVTKGGSPVAGASISWDVTAGGGSVNPTSSTTDAGGQASTAWTLGASAGTHTATATLSGATGSPATFNATATTPAPSTAAVSVIDNAFQPQNATVAAGGTVTWTWNGSNTHNVTFATGTNSATQASGTFSRTFNTAGSFDYQCSIHGSAMSGTIIVQ